MISQDFPLVTSVVNYSGKETLSGLTAVFSNSSSTETGR